MRKKTKTTGADPARPLQKRAIRTRERLFSAARAEFSKRGFHGARVDRIAAAAGVNKQRLYALFGSKSGLFKEVLRSALAEIEAEEKRLDNLTETDANNLAETLLDHYLAFHGRRPHFWRLLTRENLEGGKHSAGLAGMPRATFRRLQSLYQKAQQRGLYPAKTDFTHFLFIITALSYFAFSNQATLRRTLGLDFRDARARKTLIRNLAGLITRHNAP